MIPAPLQALLDRAGTLALHELERALRLRLRPSETAVERRLDELGPLARMLRTAHFDPRAGLRVVAPGDYDAARPEDAPNATLLAERYGDWRRACRAAQHLLDDGRYTGDASPWSSPALGQSRPPAYTLDEINTAIRRCALALGRHPSSTDYVTWSRAQKRHARETGADDRIPGIYAIYRQTPKAKNRWRLAVTRALITDNEIADAINARIPELAHGDGRRDAEPGAMGDDPDDDTSAYVLDGPAIRRRREQLGISDTALRNRLSLQIGPWRRMLYGRDRCPPATVDVLACLLTTRIDAIASRVTSAPATHEWCLREPKQVPIAELTGHRSKGMSVWLGVASSGAGRAELSFQAKSDSEHTRRRSRAPRQSAVALRAWRVAADSSQRRRTLAEAPERPSPGSPTLRLQQDATRSRDRVARERRRSS